MPQTIALIPFLRTCAIILFVVSLTNAEAHASHLSANGGPSNRGKVELLKYEWNVTEKELPLLSFPGERLSMGVDRSLTYRFGQLRFPVFEALDYDEGRGRYVLPAFTTDGTSHFVEFQPSDMRNTYLAIESADIQLIDNDTVKTIRTSDGTKYVFLKYPDGEFRCATIKEASGVTLNFLYTANGLMLHGVVDASGRTLRFNYDRDGITSLTQTWMTKLEGFTKTWRVGDAPETSEPAVRYAHRVSFKALPRTAIVRQYSTEMAASDKLLASVFGGPNAVAGGNGFEPAGLAAAYPLYRGDIYGDDGIARRGHLSCAMHLYGSPDGTGNSPLYVPAGFVSHSGQPSPTDAVVTFYYPKLGNLIDVTIAVFHVADFQITPDENRVRIGNLGGPGGSSALYKHSHIEFYRGNTGLPPSALRMSLRIDPGKVFAPGDSRK